jgi:hypothetical protein
MSAAASLLRDRELADLVRDLDHLVEMFGDAQLDESDVVRLRPRDRDITLAVLQRAGDALHEMRRASP